MPPRPRKGGAARRAANSVKRSAPINTPPIYESAGCGVLPRVSGNRSWRKPRRTPRKGQGAELPHEAFAFGLLFSFTRDGFQFRRNTPTPRQTPPSARTALSHLRGAPHSALPNEAGGGEAAAPCHPAPVRAGRRAARQPRFNKVRRLARRRFMKVRIAAFCRRFWEIGHGESRGERRGGGKEASSLTRRSLLACCSLSHTAAFNSLTISPRPDKRRRPHKQRFRTCAHMRSPLRGSRLTAALALGKRRSARPLTAQTNRTKIPVRKNPHGCVLFCFIRSTRKAFCRSQALHR